MFIVALTGNIASGKSTAAGYFAEYGVPVIDADAMARTLLTENKVLQEKIVACLGAAILAEDGSIHRRALRERIFSDPWARAQVESQMHPLIYQQIQHALRKIDFSYCIVMIPLLFEGNTATITRKRPQPHQSYLTFQRILMVTATKTQKIQRAQQRDGSDEQHVHAILATQLADEVSLQKADDVLCNQSDLPRLHQMVTQLHQFYLSLAQYPHILVEQSPFLSYHLILK
jgi:dephospho-CoA kinase